MTGQALVLVTSSERTESDPQIRLAALFDAHQPRLFRLARRLAGSGEDARDLVQETFLRAARSPQSVPDGGLARGGLAGPGPDRHLPRPLASGGGATIPPADNRCA